MPKRLISHATDPGWQATGLVFAMVATAASGGIGTVLSAILVTPVILAVVRLRAHRPDAATTADLAAGTLGDRAATFTAALQLTAYTLMAAVAVTHLGLQLSVTVSVIRDDAVQPDAWLLAACALLVLAAVAAPALALPPRIVAGIATGLAAIGLLIIFYLALAVAAKALTGTPPVPVAGDSAPERITGPGVLAILALALVGFDAVLLRNGWVADAGRRLAIGVGTVTLLAALVWYADHVGGDGPERFGGGRLSWVVVQMFGDIGSALVAYAGAMIWAALLVALCWAIARLVPARGRAGAIAAMGIVVVAGCFNWAYVGTATAFAGQYLLLITYALLVEASSRIDDDSSVAWWSRIFMPAALAALFLVPMLNSRFALHSIVPVVVALVLTAMCAVTAAKLPGWPRPLTDQLRTPR